MTDGPVDIIRIDSHVRATLAQRQPDRGTDQRRMQQIERSIAQDLPEFQRRELRHELARLTRRAFDEAHNCKLDEYLLLTRALIAELRKEKAAPRRSFFAKRGHAEAGSPTGRSQGPSPRSRRRITRRFLDIAQRYADVHSLFPEAFVQSETAFLCRCEVPSPLDTEHSTVCLKCGVELEMLNKNSSFKDIHRVNMSVKYKYERAAHFKDAVMQFQGKQNKKIPPEVMADLEEEFRKHGLIAEAGPRLTATQLAELRPDQLSERYRRVTRKAIIMFLEQTGHSKHYENVNLIARCYAKPVPQIAHLERRLFEAFDKVLAVYESLDGIGRSNFLNNQYVLFQLLRLQQWPCDREQFNLIESKERLREHDEIFARICERLQWTFRPVA